MINVSKMMMAVMTMNDDDDDDNDDEACNENQLGRSGSLTSLAVMNMFHGIRTPIPWMTKMR